MAFLPAGVDLTQNVVVDMQEMNQAATFLADKCPGDNGKGGVFTHDPESEKLSSKLVTWLFN